MAENEPLFDIRRVTSCWVSYMPTIEHLLAIVIIIMANMVSRYVCTRLPIYNNVYACAVFVDVSAAH